MLNLLIAIVGIDFDDTMPLKVAVNSYDCSNIICENRNFIEEKEAIKSTF